jgi:Zn ribbon nucleic-acid-binding protein
MAFSIDGEDYRECVSCGFKDKLRLTSSPKEIQTRVNTTEDQIRNETTRVRILDPKV